MKRQNWCFAFWTFFFVGWGGVGKSVAIQWQGINRGITGIPTRFPPPSKRGIFASPCLKNVFYHSRCLLCWVGTYGEGEAKMAVNAFTSPATLYVGDAQCSLLLQGMEVWIKFLPKPPRDALCFLLLQGTEVWTKFLPKPPARDSVKIN